MTWAGLWKPAVGDIVPAEWVWTVVDALDWLYQYQGATSAEVQELKDCIEKKLDITNEYLRFLTAGKGIISITKTFTTSPEPLYVDELQVRRIVIKVPSTALYTLYIGDENTQEFPIFAGESQDLFVKDPSKVYAKSNGEVKVFLLFELARD